MSAIKFSKQFIEPNPQEVDYWVDISTNPYGGVIKYYNGETWAVLTSPDGTPINMDAFYNKLQINQMLATKASVESVESKVDDAELSDLMNNIEFKGKDGNGVDMIIFKYDGTNVGITLPIASNTTAGIITKDQFKDLVKLNQLQSLYSEMYSKVTEIYLKFQKKLKAGKNIRIDETTNTIHATGKISTDWNDLTNVPDIDGAIQAEADRAKAEEAKLSARITDHVEVVEGKLDLKADKSDIYTKDQVDEKVASVYKIIGSSTFEELPTEGNTIGDVYNITNDFTLNGVEYPFGTNVVWTADGWDTLSGVFDTTELEGLVEGVDTKIDEEIVRAKAKELELDEKFDGYLPLRGGIIGNGTSYLPVSIKGVSLVAVPLITTNGTFYFGYQPTNGWFVTDSAWVKTHSILHSGNYSNYALPLRGGVMKGDIIMSPSTDNVHSYAIQFKSLNKTRWLTCSDDGLLLGIAGEASKKIWHSGNDGEGSGLDADMLDGRQYNQFMYVTPYSDVVNFDNALGNTVIGYSGKESPIANDIRYCNILQWTSDPAVTPSVNSGINWVSQLWAQTQDVSLMYRRRVNGGAWSDLRHIAFKDSDITGNAATATKLATPVKLWGNDFDGSSDIGGAIKFNIFNPRFVIPNEDGSQSEIIEYNNVNKTFNFGYGKLDSDTIQLFGKAVKIYNRSNPILTVADTNVGIKTTYPLYQLDVNGQGRFTSNVTSNSDFVSIKLGGHWLFGSGTGDSSSDFIIAKYIDDGLVQRTFRINSSGNVTIGSSDLASTNHKLYVSGSSVFAENTFVNRNLYVDHQISSGDLVDWYGVSWSEDSSDPTCTRIGNMALHRSLPILSAMKGYVINNSTDEIVPVKEDWSGVKYYTLNNQEGSTMTFEYSNTMVKIPEFWYIDDYEPSTKTHNLKISQTAKAGWCHHKEAYVGAYEGYNSGTYYRSIKGVTPTVSVSRTTLRPLARANGYEDEYKWNIYTYEEHRAICHLFLVEYATRNSQLAVNTALTADGFKQGGLGSGCTTSTVTINGVTTYSFIPTGTTDSLGNGSGQVAYTVTQTDADGNETGTVTRYANRYRGIENPFGHIWKHVDDVITQYSADTTYRTAYKCNKPEHFSTNKNAKYKPLCSFPGGAKMQGWSKEIKATINCDFFKYSIGGSETTYWCDYNYDDDDTSEHCLLIGGRSDYGGKAGLFYFYLNDGASHSGATIGSRLTYLPWAE